MSDAPDETRPTPEEAHRARVAKALALLNDPYAYADEMRECVFSNDRLGLDGLFSSDVPARYWAARESAFDLVRRSVETPGADVCKAIGLAEDAVNHFGFALQDLGMMMGVTLEGLRRSVLATYEALKDDDDDRALALTEEWLADLRATIDARTKVA